MHKPITKIVNVIYWVLLASMLYGYSAFSSPLELSFNQYSVADGLSQSTVTDIVEDKQGFIWFATAGGLSRFDGYEFKVYQHASDDPRSLPDQFVRKLLIDNDGNLWVGTDNGLGKYNHLSDDFTLYNQLNSALQGNMIATLGIGRQGHLLVAGKQDLYYFDEQRNHFIPVKPLGETVPSEIKVIYHNQYLTFLGSYGSGLFILDHSSNILYDISKENPLGFTIDARIIYDIKAQGDTLWLGTDNGAFALEVHSKVVRRLTTESSPAIVNNTVRSIEIDEKGNLWLGTINGVSIISTNDGSVFSIDQNNNFNLGLDVDYFLKLFKDSNNTMWLGTYTDGIYKYNEYNARIRHFSGQKNRSGALSDDMVWAMAESQDGYIWVATQMGGINRFSPDNTSFKHYLTDIQDSIWDLAVDNKNRLWIASSGGLLVYQINEDASLQYITRLLPGLNVEKINYVAGELWLKSLNNKLRWVNSETLEINSIELPNPLISTVEPNFVDSQNNLWLFTNNGLVLFNIDTRQFNQLILKLEQNNTNFSDVNESDEAFWLSSASQGIIKLDKSTYQVLEHINKDNVLPSNQVFVSILNKDSLWLAIMGAGLIELSTLDNSIKSMIKPDKLKFNEINEGAGLLSSTGQLFFGGTKGLHVFSPEQYAQSIPAGIQERKQVPSITELRIFNHLSTLGTPSSPLTLPIHLTEKLALPNNTSNFSLTFAQINPIDPKGLNYRYRLLGLSDEWFEADTRTRQAIFSNLNFGEYQFVVQSREGLGGWSPGKTLPINIEAPIWLHKNALILYVALALLILFLWWRNTRARNAIQLAIATNEERLKLTLWSSGDELWDWDIHLGQVFRSNTWGTIDFPQDDIRSNSAYESNIHPNDLSRIQTALNEHLEQKTEHYEVAYRTKNFKGKWLWVLDRGKVVHRDEHQQAQRMTGTLKDISHLKIAEEQLNLFKRSIETISDGVFIADTNFRFISVNNSYCKHTGETREQALASYLTFHQYPGAFTEEVKKSLKHKGNWFGEVESRRHNGEKYEMELNIDAIHDEDGKITHYVGVFSDITSRKGTEKELLKLANTDPLTDLPNRSFFLANHSNIVRRNTHHALICLDMDNFKKINDSLGHQTGDILIKQIAKRLQKISGTEATCYRLGGDEFSILIDDSTDIHHITHTAQTILDEMSRAFLINKQEFVLGASIGIAFYPEDGSTPQELLKNADTAMYFAKNAGGNKYQFFSGEMNQNAVRQLQIENLIRHGLKEDLFTVFYQPKVDIASGKLTSMEALVRYEDPEKGIVGPSQFIALAEETGQIIDIGEVVLRKACEDTKRWVDAGLFTGRVAVNISARQFELPDLDDRIEKILKKVGLSPLHLECEITEGTLMENPDKALRMMKNLRERGIHLALDDFGTGYSSLAYLKRFPLNTLKIDKAFIDDIATSSEDRHMTAAIITIAHNLGLKVVAEGVEYENQLSILRRYECEMLQGYLYSKPLSSQRFERLLSENQELHKFIHQSKL